MTAQFNKIQAFERCLDAELDNLDIMKYDPFESAEAVGVVNEMALHNRLFIWGDAMDVLIPKLLLDSKGNKRGVHAETVTLALEFSKHYYHLRDYFHFVYNVPKSIKFNFIENNKISIELQDDSYQLQKFLELNSWLLNSKKVFSSFKTVENQTKKYVEQSKEEFVESKTLTLAYDGCIKEAELKLANYPNFLEDNFVFDFYSIEQFKAVYKHILARALLRRYFVQKYVKSRVQEHGWILAPNKNVLVEALAEASDISNSIVEKILLDLTLDKQKMKKGLGLTSFPLIYNPNEDYYLLFPSRVCFCECFDSLRKAWSIRDERLYGNRVANVVGEELAKRVEHIFFSHGFSHVKRNVSLNEFGQRLPDIDVLSVWEEPGFGYVVFLCETKNTIPEKFGKDFVKSASSTGFITKAEKQIQDISRALGGKNFYKLLKNNFPKTKLGFGTYALNFVVMTSQNIGVFSRGKTIIDCESFESLLTSSKGDILHVLSGIKRENLIASCHRCSKMLYENVRIGPFEVEFPVIAINSMLQL